MPIVTVAAIVLAEQDGVTRVLLMRRIHDPFAGRWCLPGGHIDPYEPARTAVIREVMEETGLAFDPVFFGAFDEIFPQWEWHAVVLVYAGPGTGTLVPQADEVAELAWFGLDEARQLPLGFGHNAVLDAYANRERAGS
jgi:8-oxo-dGTP diphosphatase